MSFNQNERTTHMHIIHIHHLTVNYMGREIFADLNWVIGDRDRTGLVGPNGAGKSSLLKVLVGDVIPDSGSIVKHGKLHLGYLPQDVTLNPAHTLYEAAMELPPKLAQVEKQLNAIEAKMSNPQVYGNDAALSAALEEQAALLEQYERLNGASHESQVRKYLSQLGFTEADYDLPAASLSGGQKKLVALARIAVEAPDVLLLDEPDNHLDVHGKRYLERFITGYPGGVVIISHDRYLLDEVATQIAELERGKLTVYPGNYTAYTTERELRRLRQQQQYVAQQKEIQHIEESIARFELWASLVIDERHIRQARSRRRMLDRMEERGEIIEKVVEARRMDFSVNGWRGSTETVKFQKVGMAFGDDLLFCDVNFLVRHGERVGIVGPNGAGKSVLMKLILGEHEPYEGIVKVGPSTKIGYYSQQFETLNDWLDKTPLDLIHYHRFGGEGAAVSFLLKMLFEYKQVRQPIRTLSGGERSRLQLALLMLQQPNLLLLDEPTNHLDIPSVEVLEAALEDFEGSIITISHDRYFLDRTVDRVLELDNGALTEYNGGYTDYVDGKGLG
jgi:ATP-binding cassette subfamily F protein 3